MDKLTLAGSLSVLLQTKWNLAGDLAVANVSFTDGWYNSGSLTPQVTVSDLSSPLGQWFGTVNATLHHRFLVNAWLQIPKGEDGNTQKTNIEEMRKEIWRIVNENRTGINSLKQIVPLDEGTPRHEVNQTPRILRYEIVVFGCENKP